MTRKARDELAATIELVERAYEFMLAYAAQGRDKESGGGDGPAIRTFVTELADAVALIPRQLGAFRLDDEERNRRFLEFAETVSEDCDSANRAVRIVLSSPVITSQLIDNLNASVHLRTLLTDLFIVDDVLRR